MLRGFKLNRCDWYVVMYVLYMMQGVLYPTGAINQLLQLGMILMAFINAVPVFLPSSKKPDILNATALLVMLYVVYGGICALFKISYPFSFGGMSSSYTYLQSSLNSLLPIFFFYVCAKRGYLSEERIKAYFFVLLLLSLYRYYQNLVTMKMEADANREEFTNNVGYSFVSLIAFLPLIKKTWLRYALLMLCGFFIVSAMKRGAILIGGVCAAWMFYRDFKTTRRAGAKIAVFTFILCAIVASAIYVEKMYNESQYFQQRVEQTEEGYSSGRDVIYSKVWNSYWDRSTALEMIFGKGANSTIPVAGNYAHQDWLETLHDTGLVGTVILLYFFIAFWRMCRRSRHFLAPEHETSLWLVFILVAAQTMFSMSIQSLAISSSMLLAYWTYYSEKRSTL